MFDKEMKNSGTIIIPTLNIEELIQNLVENINKTTKDAEEINILNPFTGFFRLKDVSKQKNGIAEEYDKKLKKCFDLLASPVEGPGMTMSFSQSWSTAKGLSAVIKLQEIWRNLDALIDRKYAYSVAVFSLYIALFSLVLTIFSLF